jgi:metal-sulfur cluster biosynthetic enzyme
MQEQEFVGGNQAVAPDPDRADAPGSDAPTPEGGTGSLPDQIREALKNVFDPELGINIVDLGLVYDVRVDEQGGVDIEYTLTTMGCPIGPLIEDQMQALVSGVPGVDEVRPEMVLRPAWNPEMMSDEAKAALGIF